MNEVILVIVEMMNEFHDVMIGVFSILGINITDKEMHFWVLGIFGLGLFFFTHFIFKRVSKWSISSLSFIYTFTVLVVIVFAIEIQQKVTSRGNMEFQDAIQGLWGFIVLFSIYAAIKLIFLAMKKSLKSMSATKNKKGKTRFSRNHQL
ncbi:hypothetical protein ACFFIX_03580 [Metabacillus herbersteinensis]|uniref:Spore cortex biosynthesis protein YabQ n=1 Tax=Metabacillus herbersteinensis TaxID=283816 RepID=A0ABV6GA34_9BACI